MEVTAKKNIIYNGTIYSAGEKFICAEEKVSVMKSNGLIDAEELAGLPSLEEEIRRKKR